MMWAAVALGMGIGGSLHCAAMCGPLVFSVNSLNEKNGLNLQFFQYHAGRILAYIGLALTIRFFILPLVLFGLQQYIALLSGVILGLFVLKNKFSFTRYFFNSISKKLSHLMNKKNSYWGTFLGLGFLNGLLPCGLSFGVAALSLNQPNVGSAMLFMVFFGIGTLPVFAFGNWMASQPFWKKWNINKGLNYAMGVMAILLIVRGSGLGIPYLSPKPNLDKNTIECCE